MRNERELLGQSMVYPGHPLVIAYLITCKYASFEEAAGIPDGKPYPGALGDSDIPGAGGNVHNALDVLRAATNGVVLDEVFVRGDMMWGYCDNMSQGGNNNNTDPKFGRDYYLKRYNDGQAQADAIKDKLREKLATWPKKRAT